MSLLIKSIIYVVFGVALPLLPLEGDASRYVPCDLSRTRPLLQQLATEPSSIAHWDALLKLSSEDRSPNIAKDIVLIVQTGFTGTRVSTQGLVLRHFINGVYAGEDLKRMLETQTLTAGSTPYVYRTMNGRFADYYSDWRPEMTGVFFTRPGTAADDPQVGLFTDALWVDVRLPRHPWIIAIRDRVFLFPGIPQELHLPVEIIGHSPLDQWKPPITIEWPSHP